MHQKQLDQKVAELLGKGWSEKRIKAFLTKAAPELERISDYNAVLIDKLHELGITNITDVEIPEDGNYHEVTKMNIDPKSVGALQSVFTEISVTVNVGIDEHGNLHLLLQYNWEHPRGSNGYTVRLTYRNREWKDFS